MPYSIFKRVSDTLRDSLQDDGLSKCNAGMTVNRLRRLWYLLVHLSFGDIHADAWPGFSFNGQWREDRIIGMAWWSVGVLGICDLVMQR